MSEDAGPEELLDSRPRSLTRWPRWPRWPRWQWPALALVGAVLVVGGIVMARDDDAPRATAASTPASAPASTPAAAPASPVVSTVPRTVCLDVGDSALNCGVSAALPPATVAAARTVLPAATVVTATTVTGRDGRVYSRRVLVRAGDGSTLQLRISPDVGPPGAADVTGTNEGRTVRYGEDVGRRRVEVTVSSETGSPAPTITALQRLVRDPRLFAVG